MSTLAFFQEFFRGKSIVLQIAFLMLIFLLFSDQISGRSLRGEVNCPRGGRASLEESQVPWGCSVPWGYSNNKRFFPDSVHDIPHGTEHPHGTEQDIPHMHHESPTVLKPSYRTEHPHGSEHLHGTERTLYRVIYPNAKLLMCQTRVPFYIV